jgi:hypothetical protein
MGAWLNEGASQHGDNRIHGQTALFDAVLAATKILGSTHSGDAIYAITDGGDNSSHISGTVTRKLLLESGIRLFAFLFAEPAPFPELRAGTESLKEMCHATGGFVFGVTGRPSVSGLSPDLGCV